MFIILLGEQTGGNYSSGTQVCYHIYKYGNNYYNLRIRKKGVANPPFKCYHNDNGPN